MMILKHYKNGIWLVESERDIEEIMQNTGGAFTVYKDVTEDDIKVLQKYGIIK